MIHTNSYYSWIFPFQWHSLWNMLQNTIEHTIFYVKILCTFAKKDIVIGNTLEYSNWHVIKDDKNIVKSMKKWSFSLSKTTFADVNVDLTNAGMLIKLSQQYEVSIGAGFWLASSRIVKLSINQVRCFRFDVFVSSCWEPCHNNVILISDQIIDWWWTD